MSTKTEIKAKMTVTVCLGGKEIELTEAEARKLKAELDAIFKEPTTVIREYPPNTRSYPQWPPAIPQFIKTPSPFPDYDRITCQSDSNQFIRRKDVLVCQ